ncbi:uncharacterized protein LOC124102427 [Marmota monax]|uniref:uncharacterized protein LOC124102427 n=1 Tax=Marmota monax TaxID=9995 RepID=UPI001EAFCAB9|nr:uncharacterized protein LOC124102427 [Marmota monax]XP_046314678.1 uncharacterized protein LOC124102427 [Marmota monax]XP_046314679.1 uncharacterized protein LOC124102427 [Marmota monax]XP_058439712.1 uncharacterized protein LOC124102427 [Marmota monax]XP_058439713.1 uncharacterized protein LOC124102427 [Marmota monax]
MNKFQKDLNLNDGLDARPQRAQRVKICPGIFETPPLADVAGVCRAGTIQWPSVLWGCMSQLQPRNRYQSRMRTPHRPRSRESTIKGSWVNSPKASLFRCRWHDPCVPLGSPPPPPVCDRVTMKPMMLGQRSQVHGTPELLTQSHLLMEGHGTPSLCPSQMFPAHSRNIHPSSTLCIQDVFESSQGPERLKCPERTRLPLTTGPLHQLTTGPLHSLLPLLRTLTTVNTAPSLTPISNFTPLTSFTASPSLWERISKHGSLFIYLQMPLPIPRVVRYPVPLSQNSELTLVLIAVYPEGCFTNSISPKPSPS